MKIGARSEICGFSVLRSMFYVLYMQFTEFVPKIFFVFRVQS